MDLSRTRAAVAVRGAARKAAGGSVVLGVLLVAACSAGAVVDDGTATGSPHVASTAPSSDVEAYAAQLLAATNAARAEEGVPALEESECAVEAARERATALVGAPLEHALLDGVVSTCAPAGGTAAENLSRAAADPGAVVEAWMGSSGHRANVLDATMTAVGIACVPDASEGEGGVVCSQVFLG